jgi:hypothetical protein
VARRNACEDRARLEAILAPDSLAGGDGGKGPGRGYAQGVHGFPDQVLPQDGSEHRLAISAPRERGATRSFELQVASDTVPVDQLTDQQRPSVTELR